MTLGLRRIGLAACGGLLTVVAAFAVPSCNGNEDAFGEIGGYVDGGADATFGGGTSIALAAPDGSASLKAFPYPQDPGAGAFYVTISGESNALTGYPFPPADFTADTYMVDGWNCGSTSTSSSWITSSSGPIRT